MNAVITWKGGLKVIKGAELGDERVAAELHRLAARELDLGMTLGVSLNFVEDDTAPTGITGENDG